MMRNCYKREDIFACRHESHRSFAYRVSAHHVLREKDCFPSGCVNFRWKCKLLGKGGRCPKGYRHVGNNCTQCSYYDEEKVHRYPELLLTEAEYRAYLDECRQFDDWLEDHVGRQVDVGGRITDLRPHLTKRVDGPRTTLRLRGFLVRLRPGYIGRSGFEDAVYLRISGAQQERHRLAVGDAVEAEGLVRFDRGRLVAGPVRRLRVEERSGTQPATWDRAILDRAGAVTVADQPGRCLRCARGILIDLEDIARDGYARRRELLCLEGIGRPSDCPYEALQAMRRPGD